jgi:hypothetical protein
MVYAKILVNTISISQITSVYLVCNNAILVMTDQLVQVVMIIMSLLQINNARILVIRVNISLVFNVLNVQKDVLLVQKFLVKLVKMVIV